MSVLMKTFRVFCLCAFLAFPILLVQSANGQNGREVLNNDAVITMVKAGLPTNVIVNKIRSSQNQFDLSTNELVRLKQSGINEDILMAMQGYSEISDPRPTAPSVYNSESVDPNDPMARHTIGIYHYTERHGVRKMNELEPSVVTSSHTTGMIGTKLTYGIWQNKQKAKLAGGSAQYQVTDPEPVFYFFLNEKDRTMAAVKYFPASVSQFQLVRFDVKGHDREVTVGKSSEYTNKVGIQSNFLVPVNVEKIGDGVFKVTPRGVLKSGEYGFFMLGTGASVGATFFDWSFRPIP
jgi:hypothetical protein